VNRGTGYSLRTVDWCFDSSTILPSTTRTTVVPMNSSRLPVGVIPSSSPV
jgi:hypothetical protein